MEKMRVRYGTTDGGIGNVYRIVGDDVEIDIFNRGQHFIAYIDLADLPRLLSSRCFLVTRAKKNTTYVHICLQRGINDWKTRSFHRWLLEILDDRTKIPDHLDGNGLNNRRSNLKITTAIDNSFNKKTSTRSTSGVRGVYPGKRGLWRVRIQHNGVRKSFGGFVTIEAATEVARQAFRDAGAVRLPLANREMELVSPGEIKCP